MYIFRVENEPFDQASRRRTDVVTLLKLKKNELDRQVPSDDEFFTRYGELVIELGRAMDSVEQQRRLVLFGKMNIPLPSRLIPSRIEGVNF